MSNRLAVEATSVGAFGTSCLCESVTRIDVMTLVVVPIIACALTHPLLHLAAVLVIAPAAIRHGAKARRVHGELRLYARQRHGKMQVAPTRIDLGLIESLFENQQGNGGSLLVVGVVAVLRQHCFANRYHIVEDVAE